MNTPLYLSFVLQDFPAQAAAWAHPDLRGAPFVIIQQRRDEYRSCVLACSEGARAAGILPGMSIREAGKRCARLQAVGRDEAAEHLLCEKLEQMLESFTPEYVLYRDGEAVLDLAGTPLVRKYAQLSAARHFREHLLEASGVFRAAMGISSCRLLARMLAASAAPSGFGYSKAGEETEILAAMDPRWFPGLSSIVQEKLAEYRFDRAGQLRRYTRAFLCARFGTEGERLYYMVRGMEAEPRCEDAPLEGAVTLETQTNHREQLRQKVRLAADKLCFLLKDRGQGIAGAVLELIYTDGKTAKNSLRLAGRTSDFLTLADSAERTFWELYNRRAALKSIVLRGSRPSREDRQTDLFNMPQRRKQDDIGTSLSKIRMKNGFNSIMSGSNAEDLQN